MPSTSRGWVIAATFLIALMLTALPLPPWAASWRPAWVAMVLIYWNLAMPEHVGLAVAFAIGLLLDVMLSAPMGQNALALTTVSFVTVANHQRFRLYPVGQQAIIVGLLILLHQLLTFLVRQFLTLQKPDPVSHWFPVITSTMLWPWLFILLRDLRRRAQLN